MAALARLVPPERGTILRVAEAAELPVMMRQGLENRRAPIERGRIAVRAKAPLPFQSSVKTAWPTVAAYDVTTPAPRALVHLESGRGDPLIASARVGLGQVVAVTPGLGAWTPDWLRWQDWPALAGGLVEWVSSSGSASGLSVAVDRSASDAARRCRRRQRRQVVGRRLGTGTRAASVRAHDRHAAGDVRGRALERRDRRTGGRSLHALGHCTGRGTTPRPPACAAAGVRRRAAESGYRGVGAGRARARVVTRDFPGSARTDCRRPRGVPIAQCSSRWGCSCWEC